MILTMLYTRKGDDGTTKTFGCSGRISKSSLVTEALGSLDEINSLLGWCKVKSGSFDFLLDLNGNQKSLSEIIGNLQQDLFVIQAELAGADKKIGSDRTIFLETVTDKIEKELPLITSFIVSGGIELSAMFDFARTIARRTERSVIRVKDDNLILSSEALSYLNRLSSVLYALSRFVNVKSGVVEDKPHY